jgi:23S rRNA (adenine2503-C2)-methyltransferase
MWNDIKRVDDADQNVAKFIFTKDDAVAESVLYRYPTYRERTVICISTQSGCPVGCRFCGAGDYFVRSLTADEIVDQAVHALKQAYRAEEVEPEEMGRLQIMFMSMGEPLLNLKNLEPAIRTLYAAYPNAALLISTIGPDIGHLNYHRLMDLCADVPTVGLQFSVHESTDAARDDLIPFKKKLTLGEIAFYGHLFHTATARRPFFNYCAHDANSTPEDAQRIANLFPASEWNATVSVVCERSQGFTIQNEHQRELAVEFASKLLGHGFDTRVFDPAGQDTIGGGCGQLFHVQNWMKKNPELVRPSVGNGLDVRHAPNTVTRRTSHVQPNINFGALRPMGDPICRYPTDNGLPLQVGQFDQMLSIGEVLAAEFVPT